MNTLYEHFKSGDVLPTFEMLKVLNSVYHDNVMFKDNNVFSEEHDSFRKRMFLANEKYNIYVDAYTYELYAWTINPEMLSSSNNRELRMQWYSALERDSARGATFMFKDYFKRQLPKNALMLIHYQCRTLLKSPQKVVDFLNAYLSKGYCEYDASVYALMFDIDPVYYKTLYNYGVTKETLKFHNFSKAGFKFRDSSMTSCDIEEFGVYYTETLYFKPLDIKVTFSYNEKDNEITYDGWRLDDE